MGVGQTHTPGQSIVHSLPPGGTILFLLLLLARFPVHHPPETAELERPHPSPPGLDELDHGGGPDGLHAYEEGPQVQGHAHQPQYHQQREE